MKKLIAMLACLTMVITMFAGLTVSAADYGTPTVKLTFTSFNSKGYAQVSVDFEGFENFAEFDQDLYDSDGYMSATGISAMSANFTVDNGTYQGGTKKLCAVSSATSGVQSCNVAAADASEYVTAEKGQMAIIRYEIADKSKDTTITLSDAIFEVTATVEDEITDTKVYRLADLTVVPCVILGEKPAVNTAVTFDTAGVKGIVANAVTTAVEGTVTIDVTPAFGSKIANVVTTDGTAAYTANGGTITISGLTAETATVTITTAEDDATGVVTFATPYVDGDTAYVFGKVTNVADEFGVKLDGEAYAANGATAEKVFGIAFKGLVAGTYSAAAYDSTADGNAIDVVIAE